jgi:hypothetical protein
MTVRELLARTDSVELSEWIAYYRLEPFGPLRWALYAANIVIACLAPWRKKNSARMRPSDIFPELSDGETRAALPGREALEEKLRAWATAMSKGFAGGMKAK